MVYHFNGDDNMTGNTSGIYNIYESLKKEILIQELKPGSRLRERELAEKYQVSRTPVRQALQQLATEGLVEFIPYKGAVIKDLTIEEFKDITQLRAVLEKLAIETCGETNNETVIENLEKIIEKQKIAIINQDIKEYSLLDQDFHSAIVQKSSNKELKNFIEFLNQRSYLSRVRTLTLPGRMEKSIIEHQQILECIILKDKEAAGQKAIEHVNEGLKNYISAHNVMAQFK